MVYLIQLAQCSIMDVVKQCNAAITQRISPYVTTCESLYSVRYALRQKRWEWSKAHVITGVFSDSYVLTQKKQASTKTNTTHTQGCMLTYKINAWNRICNSMWIPTTWNFCLQQDHQPNCLTTWVLFAWLCFWTLPPLYGAYKREQPNQDGLW